MRRDPASHHCRLSQHRADSFDTIASGAGVVGLRRQFEQLRRSVNVVSLTATFFLVPGFISRECMAWWERVSWVLQQASRRTMNRAGHAIDVDDVKARIELQKTPLRELKRLNRGDYSIETIEAARHASYAYAVTTIHGRNTNEPLRSSCDG